MKHIPYQKALEGILQNIEPNSSTRPSLLLHSCCAPCSSYVLQYLHPYFRITLLYFNPNIFPEEEYTRRLNEQQRLLTQMGLVKEVTLIAGDYDPNAFFTAVKGLEQQPEGGSRCRVCFALRLEEAAKYARRLGADYFCTTLSISPHKNAPLLNTIGQEIAEKYGIPWLPSDFKKKGGYQASIQLSHQYDLYRQDYCGCVYSKAEAQARKTQSSVIWEAT